MTTTSDEIKHANKATSSFKPRKRMLIVIGIISVVVSGALLIWYLAIIAPDQRFKRAMNHAEQVINTGSSVQNGQEADKLASQASKFRTKDQREAAFRKVGQLYFGKGDTDKALVNYFKAEAIRQTSDFALMLRIAYLAQTGGNNMLAIAYYQRALDQFNKNPQAYSKVQQDYMKSIPALIDSLKGQQ